jgi:phage repressor protein C with HTH and peptisase S24 domain
VAKKQKLNRYKNPRLLKAIGQNCQKLRVQKGYSIDRLYREGEQLSTSVIHRLENGTADTQLSVFYRYAQVLGLNLKELFDVDIPREVSHRVLVASETTERPKSAVPYYDINVAAGAFKSKNMIASEEPQGWVQVSGYRNLNELFAVRIKGKSMEPTIPNDSLCLFRLYQGGSKQGKIFLIRSNSALGTDDSDTAYVVKRYKRMPASTAKSGLVVHLNSDNKDYAPIIFMGSTHSEDEMIQVVGEFVDVLE